MSRDQADGPPSGLVPTGATIGDYHQGSFSQGFVAASRGFRQDKN
jgi:hypothetical protein